MTKKTSKKIAKPMPINDRDMAEMQIYAARYAHNRRTFATQTMNQITAQLLDAGFILIADATRDAPQPTVWAMDGDFGWPQDLIAKYGWDGKRMQKEMAK
jgi:hypothetical protein